MEKWKKEVLIAVSCTVAGLLWIAFFGLLIMPGGNFAKDITMGEWDLEGCEGTTWVCSDPPMALKVTFSNEAKGYALIDGEQKEVTLEIHQPGYVFYFYDEKYNLVFVGDHSLKNNRLSLKINVAHKPFGNLKENDRIVLWRID